MSDKVDWTTLTNGSNYIQLGSILICWGTKSWSNPNTGAQGENNCGDITFPKAYKSTPAVIVTMDDLSGGCGEYWATSGRSTTKFNVWGGHIFATSSTTQTISWVSIGVAA